MVRSDVSLEYGMHARSKGGIDIGRCTGFPGIILKSKRPCCTTKKPAREELGRDTNELEMGGGERRG